MIRTCKGALAFTVVIVGITFCGVFKGREQTSMITRLHSSADISGLFPKTPAEFKDQVTRYTAQMRKDLQNIIDIPAEQRTFANTAQALDDVTSLSDLMLVYGAAHALKMVSPDAPLRTAAQEAIVQIQDFLVDNVSNNKKLYNAFKEYAEGDVAKREDLTEEQRYYLTETMKDYRRGGLDLPDEQRTKIAKLEKELGKLSQDFSKNISDDNRTIAVPLEGLQGLEQDFIATLKRNDAGEYLLGVDYPTNSNVMENCTVQETRKKLYHAFNNRAYPANEGILKTIIAKRDELAKLLGFASFAHLNLDDKMVGVPERAEQFLDDLIVRVSAKEQQEFDQLVALLPDSVTLNADGKMNPWDSAFTKATYKKKNYSIDERKIAEYFPMAETVEGLLDIYRQFLGIDFVQAPISNLWHDEVKLVQVYNQDQSVLHGYLLLDLHPRDNKYSHACEMGIIPAVHHEGHAHPPALALVIANFPKPTEIKPSLLTRSDVQTFFHEFGHALHALLGRTNIASFSGTSVKRDFVELPSQMLEEWLWDADVLKQVSRHYKTGEPLPDDIINNIFKLKHFDSGHRVQRQAYLAKASLAYYKSGAVKDVHGVMQGLHNEIIANYAFAPNGHMFASFGHLMGYGAGYYSYLWSQVFALDMFNDIKKGGLLNAEIGRKYIKDVIGKGGSKDPNDLLVAFLGREPNQEAFFADLGI